MAANSTSNNVSPEFWFEGDDESLPDEQEEAEESDEGEEE